MQVWRAVAAMVVAVVWGASVLVNGVPTAADAIGPTQHSLYKKGPALPQTVKPIRVTTPEVSRNRLSVPDGAFLVPMSTRLTINTALLCESEGIISDKTNCGRIYMCQIDELGTFKNDVYQCSPGTVFFHADMKCSPGICQPAHQYGILADDSIVHSPPGTAPTPEELLTEETPEWFNSKPVWFDTFPGWFKTPPVWYNTPPAWFNAHNPSTPSGNKAIMGEGGSKKEAGKSVVLGSNSNVSGGGDGTSKESTKSSISIPITIIQQ